MTVDFVHPIGKTLHVREVLMICVNCVFSATSPSFTNFGPSVGIPDDLVLLRFLVRLNTCACVASSRVNGSISTPGSMISGGYT